MRFVEASIRYSNFALQYLAISKMPSVQIAQWYRRLYFSNGCRSSVGSWNFGDYSRNCLHNVTDFYVGFFGVGIGLGGLVTVCIVNRSRIKTRCKLFLSLYKNTCAVKICNRFECASNFLLSHLGKLL